MCVCGGGGIEARLKSCSIEVMNLLYLGHVERRLLSNIGWFDLNNFHFHFCIVYWIPSSIVEDWNYRLIKFQRSKCMKHEQTDQEISLTFFVSLFLSFFLSFFLHYTFLLLLLCSFIVFFLLSFSFFLFFIPLLFHYPSFITVVKGFLLERIFKNAPAINNINSWLNWFKIKLN